MEPDPFRDAARELDRSDEAENARRERERNSAQQQVEAVAKLCREFLDRLRPLGFPGTRTFGESKRRFRKDPGHECYLLVYRRDSDAGDFHLILSTDGLVPDSPRGSDRWVPIEQREPWPAIYGVKILTESMARILRNQGAI